MDDFFFSEDKHEFEDISGQVNVWVTGYEYPVRFERTFVCRKFLKKKKLGIETIITLEREKRMDNLDNELTLMDALLRGMTGENPSKAIENQEKRGQQTVVRNQILPKKANDLNVPERIRSKGVKGGMSWEEARKIMDRNSHEYTKNQYEKMGISVVGEYDDLFYNVQLPCGWEIKATDHPMWNDLLDDNGRKRAKFFYKAAFYDRNAFINFEKRFHVFVSHTADPHEDYDVWRKSDLQGRVKDGESIIFETKTVKSNDDYQEDYKTESELMKALVRYMEEHYPDYKDINAYWD